MLHQSQPSLRISVWLPHSGHFAPCISGALPRAITTLAEILRQNGYSTAAFGKYHETPPWEVSVSGPYDRWPTGSGFDKSYGFIGGETNQWAPAICDAGLPHVKPVLPRK